MVSSDIDSGLSGDRVVKIEKIVLCRTKNLGSILSLSVESSHAWHDGRTTSLADEQAEDAASCTLCPLYRNATQTVFGEGRTSAAIMLVGEQPGDQEDLAGHPFVGPAGRLLDRALAEAGLDRRKTYLTNVVKHFKNEPRGKKRLHKRPNRYEVEVCRVWLRKEIDLVRPQLILALGVTAAVALTGRSVVLSRERGKVIEFMDEQRGMVTAHPSSILRMPDQAARHAAFAGLVKDLKAAMKHATG